VFFRNYESFTASLSLSTEMDERKWLTPSAPLNVAKATVVAGGDEYNSFAARECSGSPSNAPSDD